MQISNQNQGNEEMRASASEEAAPVGASQAQTELPPFERPLGKKALLSSPCLVLQIQRERQPLMAQEQKALP
ncbi:MAG: hypothetical protein PHS03_01530 [Sphaerochaeta sp.]|nr:hypothetical protein [Sphaerochaeta sp.]